MRALAGYDGNVKYLHIVAQPGYTPINGWQPLINFCYDNGIELRISF